MNAFRTRKAANLRRFLGVVLFAAIVGLGIAFETMENWGSLAGWFLIVFGGLALAAWGSVTARRMAADAAPHEGPTS